MYLTDKVKALSTALSNSFFLKSHPRDESTESTGSPTKESTRQLPAALATRATTTHARSLTRSHTTPPHTGNS